MPHPDRPRLDSWKEIARHLRRDVRTVIRWEQRRGMPVHRLPGGKVPRVFAYPDELDRWLESRTAEPEEAASVPSQPDGALPTAASSPSHPWRPWLVAAGCFIAIGATTAVWSGAWERPPATQFTASGDQLTALDAEGRIVWTHRVESGTLQPEPRLTYVGDLYGDERPDALVSVGVTRPPATEFGAELLAFDANGGVRWALEPTDRLTFRDGEYGPPWPASSLTVFRAANQPRIAWTLHHFTWWPSMVVSVDATGKRLGTFVNSGWITATVASPDERHLLLSGTSKGHRASFFAALNAVSPSGRSPEPPGSPTECVTCPSAGPDVYIVFPRTDVSRLHPFPGTGPSIMTYSDGAIRVHAIESEGPSFAAVIYELERDFAIREARFADSFWEWHARLEGDGRITHTAANCPHRKGLDVQRWTPATGWQTVAVPVR